MKKPFHLDKEPLDGTPISDPQVNPSDLSRANAVLPKKRRKSFAGDFA